MVQRVTTLAEAAAQMLAAGMPEFPPGHPVANTGRVVRYGPKKRAWYRLYEHSGRNGKFYVSGAFGLWGLIEKLLIESDYSGLDTAERDRIIKTQREAEQREKEKRASRAQFAATRAKKQWLTGKVDPPIGKDTYLTKKQVAADSGLKFADDGTLYVPALRYGENDKGELVGLQKITPAGEKRFNRGMAKEGAACRIGTRPANRQTLIVAEGIATALSIRMALSKRAPVFVAFDCYNLLPVAKILRAKFPDSAILFCADDDAATDGNPGKSCAEKAAAVVGNASVCIPVFTRERDPKWTDFNDLHVAEGLDVVCKQLEPLIVKTANAGKKKEDVRPKKPVGFWGEINRRFTLIYPSDTAWDDEIEKIVKLSHMRHLLNDAIVDWWLENPDRRVVTMDNVVFDPSCSCDPATTVNLFRGLALEPDANKPYQKIMELLQFLCGEEDQEQAPVTMWVLKWTAYAFQNLGAKMRTAIVMHGPEGTGKNIFWGMIASLYGPYGGLINQFQLQSQFNDWASRKMFVVANEVVTRMELKHLVGYLKTLVTEERIPIEAKNMPVREEANHMQLVFLSNELRPLHLSPGDRRYMVIKTPKLKSRAYYRAVDNEIKAGGAQGFLDFLLKMDLTDFDEHTLPLGTDAKDALIDLGLPSSQLMMRELRDGTLPIPYGPCTHHDLYELYKVYCGRTGDKFPAKRNLFAAEVMDIEGVRKKDKCRVLDPASKVPSVKQFTVYLLGDLPAGLSEDDWIKAGVPDFHAALQSWIGEREYKRKGDGGGGQESEQSKAESYESVRNSVPVGAGDE